MGTLAATAALYLPHLAVDREAFRAVTGAGLPSIWQELGGWGRPAAALLAAALVAAAFRPGTAAADRLGGVGALLLAAGVGTGGWLVWQAGRDDAAVVSAALAGVGGEGGGASAGIGFWVLMAGAGMTVAGALWDLAAVRPGAGTAEAAGEAASVGEQNPAAPE